MSYVSTVDGIYYTHGRLQPILVVWKRVYVQAGEDDEFFIEILSRESQAVVIIWVVGGVVNSREGVYYNISYISYIYIYILAHEHF